MKKENFCRVFRNSDDYAVEALVETTFSGFLEGKYWKWKYRNNPYFNSELVAVAENKGEVIGCNHWLMRDLKLSQSITDKAMLAADIAVKPEYRGKGIGKNLLQFLRSLDVVKNRRVALIYMFAEPDLVRNFHTPAARYALAPDGTVQYTKVLSWKRVKENVDSINEEIRSGRFRTKLSPNDLRVFFKMSAAPPLCIHIKEDGLAVEDGENLEKDADVVVSGDLSVFIKIKMGKRRKWNFIIALLTGKLKVKAKLMGIFSLFGVLWIFEEVFSRKMTYGW